MTDRRRRRWHPRNSWFVAVLAALALVLAAVGGLRLLRGSDDEVSTTGRCAGAKYSLSAARDDADRQSARLRITTSRPGQEWAVRFSAGGIQVLSQTVASNENAKIVVDAPLGSGEAKTEISARIDRSDKDPCTVRVTLG